jgi:predicted ATPase/DNA-binding SARP family transcriptional activator
VQVSVLGEVELVGADGPVPLRATMQRRLLASLVIAGGEVCSTDALIDAIWGMGPPPSAAKLLQVYVSQLRKLLPAPARIVTRGRGYALELPDGALDSTLFERLVAEGRETLATGNQALASSILARALALWRGPAFGDFRYEDFAREERARLEELRLLCAEARFEAELELGHHEHVLADLKAATVAHPLREGVHAQAMLALYRCGRQAEALALYAELHSRLHDELGLEPGATLRALQRRILQQDPDLAVTAAEFVSAPRLPVGPNALIGRERQLEELQGLLRRDGVRLIVLSGAGGSGKTRLALEVARAAEARFANGATFVGLAPLRDPELVVPTICTVLGVAEVPGVTAMDALVDALAPREMLLVLDNAEHLRAAALQFVELLARAPRVTLLVTSRVVLHVSGEHVYPVEPLAEDHAVSLFRERARQAEPRGPTGGDDGAVAQIVRRLDGLPLALELAAGRMRSLGSAELLERLDRRLPLLTAGPRDLPARQQTLQATLDWSYDLLEPEEQRLLARLSVFAGGCTLEAAVDVAGAEIDTLQALVDNNLVGRSGRRYRMLETIREYAGERLGALDDADTVARRHAEHFLALAERAEPELEGRSQGEWLALLDDELPNLRVALDWARAAGAVELGLRLAGALRGLWFKRGHIGEGRRWLGDLLDAHAIDDPARVKATFSAALLATIQADWSEARRLSTEAAELSRTHGDASFAAISLVTLGRALLGEGDQASAAAAFDQAIERAREHNDSAALAMASMNRGYLALSGNDLARADEELAAAHGAFVLRHDDHGIARSLAGRGSVAIHQGRGPDAVALLQASLVAAGSDRESIAWPLQLLGVARAASDPEVATTLLAAAEAIRAAVDVPLQGIELELHERAVAAVRSALPGGRFEATWSAGAGLPLEDVLCTALAQD